MPLLADLLDAFAQDVAQARATPTAPSCSTTAAARPTRSAGCCCTCTASTTPRRWRAVRRHLQRAAADQLLAGPQRRRRARPPLRAARRLRARTASRPSELLRAARQPTASRALVADARRLGARADARRRAARRTRSPAAPAGSCASSCRAACASSRRSSARPRDACSRVRRSAPPTRRCCLARLRCATVHDGSPRGAAPIAVSADVTPPEQYVQDKAAAQRLVLLLRLPVPAAAAARRDHGVLRLLPRGRRRRRRGADPGVAATKLAWWRSEVGAAFAGSPQPSGDAGADAARRRLRHQAGAPARRHRRLPDRPRADALFSTSPALARYCHLVAGVVGEVAANIFGRTLGVDGRLCASPRPRVAAHQHHPRRRRRRAARPHLPADERAASSSTSRRTRSSSARYSERFTALMRFQAERAHRTYDEALALLPAMPTARRRSRA